MVAHGQHGSVVGDTGGDLDRRAGGRVRDRVGDEVGDRLTQMILHPVDRNGHCGIEGDVPIGIGGHRIAACIGGQHGEIDAHRFDVAPLVEAGQQQEVVDQHAHALRFLLDASHDHVGVDVIVGDPEPEQFRKALDRGQRGAQLVRGVGGGALAGSASRPTRTGRRTRLMSPRPMARRSSSRWMPASPSPTSKTCRPEVPRVVATTARRQWAPPYRPTRRERRPPSPADIVVRRSCCSRSSAFVSVRRRRG